MKDIVREDLRILDQIEEIHKNNLVIIQRIKNKKEATCFCYDLSKDVNDNYKVVEEKVMLSGEEILNGWQVSLNLVPVEDFFNDDLKLDVKTFDEVLTLSADMLKISKKLKLFGGSTDATEEMKKFKANFEIISKALSGLEEGNFGNTGVLHIIEEKVAKLNACMKELTSAINLYGFQSTSRWSGPVTSHQISQDLKTASLISSQQGGLLSKNGYSSGVHTWKLKVLKRDSTCMLGIANSSVSKSSCNYSARGYFINLADGTKYSGPSYSYSNTGYTSSFTSGDTVYVTLNCNNHTLSYKKNDSDCGVAYEGLPDDKYFLCFDNDTTGGSTLELF